MPHIHFPFPLHQDISREHEYDQFKWFLQQMANRRAMGALRYGHINSRKRYMTRLLKEAQAYKKTGNAEQLLNVAVYAFLEYYAPENKNFHFDDTAESVTRGTMGV